MGIQENFKFFFLVIRVIIDSLESRRKHWQLNPLFLIQMVRQIRECWAFAVVAGSREEDEMKKLINITNITSMFALFMAFGTGSVLAQRAKPVLKKKAVVKKKVVPARPATRPNRSRATAVSPRHPVFERGYDPVHWPENSCMTPAGNCETAPVPARLVQ